MSHYNFYGITNSFFTQSTVLYAHYTEHREERDFSSCFLFLLLLDDVKRYLIDGFHIIHFSLRVFLFRLKISGGGELGENEVFFFPFGKAGRLLSMMPLAITSELSA